MNSKDPTQQVLASLGTIQSLGLRFLISPEDLEPVNEEGIPVASVEVQDFSDISELAEDYESEDEASGVISRDEGIIRQDIGRKRHLSFERRRKMRFTEMSMSRMNSGRFDNLRRIKVLRERPSEGADKDQTTDFLTSRQPVGASLQQHRSSRYRLLLTAAPPKYSHRVQRIMKELKADPGRALRLALPKGPIERTFMPINLVRWEDSILKSKPPGPNFIPVYASIDGHPPHPVPIHRLKNVELENGSWLNNIILDPTDITKIAQVTRLQLPLQDPFVQFDFQTREAQTNQQLNIAERLIQERIRKMRSESRPQSPHVVASARGSSTAQTGSGTSVPTIDFSKPFENDPFYALSCDKYYEKRRRNGPPIIQVVPGTGRGGRRVASGQGDASTDGHALPAIKLLAPFYPTLPSTWSLRHPSQTEIYLGSFAAEFLPDQSVRLDAIRTSKELTLTAGNPFLLLEYSEIRPMLHCYPGMSIQLITYYRKQEHREQVPPSESLTVLEPQDPSPFPSGFGDVFPGERLTVLQCGLFKAALFKHRCDDLLMVRQCPKTDTPHPPQSSKFFSAPHREDSELNKQFFIRPIDEMYTVSQVLPCQEIPAPASRSLGLYNKGLLQVMAARAFNKAERLGNPPTLKISRLIQFLPHFNENHLRRQCRDFSEPMHRSTNTGNQPILGQWAKKPEVSWTEEQVREFLTPEQTCLMQSMYAGQQYLMDSLYLRRLQTSEETGEDVTLDGDSETETNTNADAQTRGGAVATRLSSLPEYKQSPWIVSSNLLQSRSLNLEVNNSLDPLAFSFNRTIGRAVMKGDALRTEQMTVWDRQKKWLSSTNLDPHKPISSIALPSHLTSGSQSTPGLIIERLVNGKVECIHITDPLIVAAYRRELGKLEKRMVMQVRVPVEQKTTKAATTSSIVFTCSACGGVGHRSNHPSCPLNANYRPPTKTPAVSLENTGFEISAATGKIRIKRERLEEADREIRENLKVVLPIAKIKSTSQDHVRFDDVPNTKKKRRNIETESIESFKKKVKKSHAGSEDQIQAAKSLAEVLLEVIETLLTFPSSGPFARPVSKTKFPLYYRYVAEPRDLGTIRYKLLSQIDMKTFHPRYPSAISLLDDLRLMDTNCRYFNGPEHPFSVISADLVKRAQEMFSERKAIIDSLETRLGSKKETLRISIPKIVVDDAIEFLDTPQTAPPVNPANSLRFKLVLKKE